ncbi:MAG: DUF6391 domain-containing protein [Anaerolineales bacterium]|jgi:hypothetical protein
MANHSFVSRLQRNHGLEHATTHVLADMAPGRPYAGFSDFRGFWMIGEFTSEEVANAAIEALTRLRAGERQLAIHPNCGTVWATYGIAAGLGALTSMIGVGRRWRDKVERLPLMAVLATLALILVQPLALRLQERYTTSGDPGNLEIVEVVKSSFSGKTIHRVLTRG